MARFKSLCFYSNHTSWIVLTSDTPLPAQSPTLENTAYFVRVDLLIDTALISRAHYYYFRLVDCFFELLYNLGELGVSSRAVEYFNMVVIGRLGSNFCKPS